MILPRVVRSGCDVEELLGAAAARRKPVMTSSKISSAPYSLGDLGASLPETRGGRNAAHVAGDGFDNDGGDLVATLRGRQSSTGSRSLKGSAMVVSAKKLAARPRVSGKAQGGDAGAGFHQQRIDMAVIAAFEFDGEIASGESAGQADARSCRLRCRN